MEILLKKMVKLGLVEFFFLFMGLIIFNIVIYFFLIISFLFFLLVDCYYIMKRLIVGILII